MRSSPEKKRKEAQKAMSQENYGKWQRAKKHANKQTQRDNDARQRAWDSVYRETQDAIVRPHYTREALEQMGWQRSKGMSKPEREVFAQHFADMWEARYTQIRSLEPAPTGKTFKTIR